MWSRYYAQGYLVGMLLGLVVLFFLGLMVVFFQSAQGQVSSCGGGVSGLAACRPTFATVATLPTCNAGSQGAMYMVNDATAPTALATVAGGGAVHVGVTCNGSAWVVE